MMRITAVLKTIMQDWTAVRLHALVAQYVCASGYDAVVKAIDSLLAEGDSGPIGYREDLAQAFGVGVVAATVDTIGGEWLEALSQAVRTSDLETPAGVVAMQTLVRAEFFMSGLGQLAEQSVTGIVDAIAGDLKAMVEGA